MPPWPLFPIKMCNSGIFMSFSKIVDGWGESKIVTYCKLKNNWIELGGGAFRSSTPNKQDSSVLTLKQKLVRHRILLRQFIRHLLHCRLPQILHYFLIWEWSQTLIRLLFFVSLIRCQPSEVIPHRHGAVSGALSSDWQALEVESCFSPAFSQHACSLTHSDRLISEGQWQLVIAQDDRSSP